MMCGVGRATLIARDSEGSMDKHRQVSWGQACQYIHSVEWPETD